MDTETETLTPWQSKYQAEQAAAKQDAASCMDNVGNAIDETLLSLSLTATREKQENGEWLTILDPLNPYFKATVHIWASTHVKPGTRTASFDCDVDWRQQWKEPSKHDDHYISHSVDYSFRSYAPQETLIELDLNGYSDAVRAAMRVEFKASKRAKLIQNDIKPILTKYKALADAAQQGITAAIQKDNDTLKLVNDLRNAAGYSGHIYQSRRAHSIRFENPNLTINVSEFGTIEQVTPMTQDECRGFIAKRFGNL